MVKNVTLFIFTLLISFSASSLELGFRTTYNQGIIYNSELDISPSGLGLESTITDNFYIGNLQLRWKTGLEYSVASLGSQLSVPITIQYPFFEKNKLIIQAELSGEPGLALTRPEAMYILGGSGGLNILYKLSDSLKLDSSFRLRYSNSPQYSKNIANYSIWDISISSGLLFKL